MKKSIVFLVTRILVAIVLFTSITTPVIFSHLTASAKEINRDISFRQEDGTATKESLYRIGIPVKESMDLKERAVLERTSHASLTTYEISVSSFPNKITEYLKKLLRSVTVGHMRSMATIKWSPSKTFRHWSGGHSYVKGTTYYGIPYTQINRDNDLEDFQKKLKNGKYVGKTDPYVGNDCSSAASKAYAYALRFIGETFTTRYTGTLVPGSKYIKKVGDYSYKGSTYKSTRSNGKSKMLKAYKKLQPGDLVVVTGVSNPHVMMISETSSNGVKVIHQTTYKDKLKSTWRVDEYKSFDTLYSEGYVPVTLSIF